MEEERTYRFDASGLTPDRVLGLSGREILERIRDGRLPHAAMHATLGFRIESVAEGAVSFTAVPGRFAMNPHGVVHGGWAAALLDSVMGCAVLSMLGKGQRYTTVELSVRLVRPILPDMPGVRAEAEVIHAGRRLATARGRILGAKQRTLAHGETSCLMLADSESQP